MYKLKLDSFFNPLQNVEYVLLKMALFLVSHFINVFIFTYHSITFVPGQHFVYYHTHILTITVIETEIKHYRLSRFFVKLPVITKKVSEISSCRKNPNEFRIIRPKWTQLKL